MTKIDKKTYHRAAIAAAATYAQRCVDHADVLGKAVLGNLTVPVKPLAGRERLFRDTLRSFGVEVPTQHQIDTLRRVTKIVFAHRHLQYCLEQAYVLWAAERRSELRSGYEYGQSHHRFKSPAEALWEHMGNLSSPEPVDAVDLRERTGVDWHAEPRTEPRKTTPIIKIT